MVYQTRHVHYFSVTFIVWCQSAKHMLQNISYYLIHQTQKSKLMHFNISHENLSVKYIIDRAITQSVCAFHQRSNHLVGDFSMIDSFSLRPFITLTLVKLLKLLICIIGARRYFHMVGASQKKTHMEKNEANRPPHGEKGTP